MNYFRIFLLVIVIPMTSCIEHSENRLDSLFERENKISINSVNLSFKDNQESLDFMFELKYIDSLLIVNEFPNPYYCLKIVNLRSGEVFPFAEKGRGPGQINGQAADYSLDYQKRELFVSDKKNNYVYSIDSLIKYQSNCSPSEIFSINLENDNFRHHLYKNEKIIGGMYERQFGMYNTKNDRVVKVREYPKEGPMAWQSFFIAHPSDNIVAYLNYLSESMGLLHIVESDIKVVDILSGDTGANTNVENNTLQTMPKKGAKNGYIAACASKKYLYVLYSGKELDQSSRKSLESSFLSNRIYVFDWNGKPQKYYDLDCQVRSIAVDLNDEKLYAASYESIPTLVSFNLKRNK